MSNQTFFIFGWFFGFDNFSTKVLKYRIFVYEIGKISIFTEVPVSLHSLPIPPTPWSVVGQTLCTDPARSRKNMQFFSPYKIHPFISFLFFCWSSPYNLIWSSKTPLSFLLNGLCNILTPSIYNAHCLSITPLKTILITFTLSIHDSFQAMIGTSCTVRRQLHIWFGMCRVGFIQIWRKG